MLLLQAYRVHPTQLVGGPDWIDQERFDIVAKRPSNTTPADMPALWQSLLSDRFQLRVLRTTRDLPIYRLVLARRDGRLGAHLTKATVDCAALDAARRSAPPGVAIDALMRQCSLRSSSTNGEGIISIGGRSLDQLAASLTFQMPDRIVVNRTGLNGLFDVELRWRSERASGTLAPSAEELSIFTALQEQLGLKLEPGREPMPVIEIQSAAHPAPD